MKPPVYCLMVTGKDEKRLAYARQIGIASFDLQDYPNRHMIIVNHGKSPVLEKPRDDIYEIMVEKGPETTLGDLRNVSLDLVPLNACFSVFDDDDWRTPNYLSYMVDTLLKTRSIAVFMKNRLEHNLANGYTFRSHFRNGNTHTLCMKLGRLRYTPVDTLEDVHLQEDIDSFKKKYTAIDNDPRMYIRIIHQNNTSPFAKDNRADIVRYSPSGNYWESEASQPERDYAARVVSERYSFFLYKK